MKRLLTAMMVAGTLSLAAPGAMAQNVEVIVTQPPPPNQVEPAETARPMRPTPRHVWVRGYWHWEGPRDAGHWLWIGGHWDIPERDGAVWVEPHYDHLPDGRWRYVRGHWQNAARPQ